jgi:hypothetical protein
MDKELQEKYMAIKVRSLNAEDLFKTASLIAGFIRLMDKAKIEEDKGKEKVDVPENVMELDDDKRKEIADKMMEQIKGGGSGMEIMAVLLENAGDLAIPWLADKCSMDVKTFKKQPFDFPLYVIEVLDEQEDLKGFFNRAFSLVKKFSPIG